MRLSCGHWVQPHVENVIALALILLIVYKVSGMKAFSVVYEYLFNLYFLSDRQVVD